MTVSDDDTTIAGGYTDGRKPDSAQPVGFFDVKNGFDAVGMVNALRASQGLPPLTEEEEKE